MAFLVTVFNRRTVTGGQVYAPGDVVPEGLFAEHRLNQLRNLRRVVDVPVDGEPPEGMSAATRRFRVVETDRAGLDVELHEGELVSPAESLDPYAEAWAALDEHRAADVAKAPASRRRRRRAATTDETETEELAALPANLG